MSDYNKKYMNIAFDEAQKALSLGEVPVGAVIVKDDSIISISYNTKEVDNCCINHAEINAIINASKIINNWRLIDCDIYVTLEPCEMCAAAIKNARISNIYCAYSNNDPFIHNNVINILKSDKNNPGVNLINDLDIETSKKILDKFFNNIRND